MKKAYFAAGCFWCITPVIKEEDGVDEVYAGYCGGDESDPTYQQVKHQETGHRETIMVEYDEDKMSYERLVQLYLENVDPFDKDGQFIDRGFSYTLAVFYQNQKEKEIAEGLCNKLQQESEKEVFVSIEEYKQFYLAEEYHQNYYLKHPKEFEEELISSGRKKVS